MIDLDKTETLKAGLAKEGDVSLLAARALAVLAGRDVVAQHPRLSERLKFLSDCFIADDPTEHRDAIDKVLADGVEIDDVIDLVIPETARLLGERWFADDISFVDVSIGTARLQHMVRRLRMRERGKRKTGGRDARVLLIVPRPEEHSLGAFVAADQLRRHGISIEMSIHEHPRQVAERLLAGRFRMVAITASGVRTLAAAKEMVETVRRTAQYFLPIALGGPIISDNPTACGKLDVDIQSNDICEAAASCGLLTLKKSPRSGS